MNHKPFEDLLFTSDGLTNAERTILHEHLDICEDCRSLSHAWEHVAIEMRTSPLAEPAPGFTKRWQIRLVADMARRHRRQSLLMLTFSILGASLLVGALVILSLPLAGSPLALGMAWLSRVSILLSAASVTQDILATLLKMLANTISPLWLVLVLGVGSLAAVLWAASLRVLLLPRRVTK